MIRGQWVSIVIRGPVLIDWFFALAAQTVTKGMIQTYIGVRREYRWYV